MSTQLSLDDSSILITGGTGSFGTFLVEHLLASYRVRRLIVFSRDEMKQYEMAQRFGTDRYGCMRYFIGDVRDADRMTMAMRGVDYVVHAAALKHVPTAEYNPFECIHTNVLGAENVVNAALKNNVKRVIALSTDKAANPVNLYGASKLASDKIFIAANNIAGNDPTRFSIVRYGNVFGSRGSVVPAFRRLIAGGAESLPVTDTRMTRFCITLEQGVRFVLYCLDEMRGGEIFVPKIPSMRITDLAQAMAPQLPIRIVGIRPGEKLHEIMVTGDDARTTYKLADRYIIEPELSFWSRPETPSGAANPVEDGFSYASNTNAEWLDTAQLAAMLEPGTA